MAVKLKSVLKRIHWSLALKAAVFAASWFLLPLWLFFLIALYLYFVPPFQSGKLVAPFLVLMFFATTLTPSLWLAALFGVLWYLILGIKDLVFIDRKEAYESLVLLLIFFSGIRFFAHFDSWSGIMPLLADLLFGAAVFLLCKGFLGYVDEAHGVSRERKAIAAVVAALVIFEAALIIVFLPLHFLYQASLFFITALVFLESVFEYARGALTRRMLLMNFSIFFVFLVIILGSAKWTL